MKHERENDLVEWLNARLIDELESRSDELARQLAVALSIETRAQRPFDEERLQFVQYRIALLEQLIAGLAQVDPATITFDRIGFGSIVCVRDSSTGDVLLYTLNTGDVLDLKIGQVSLASPIGHALLGRASGDQTTVATPRGLLQFEILGVATLPHRLGVQAEDDAIQEQRGPSKFTGRRTTAANTRS